MFSIVVPKKDKVANVVKYHIKFSANVEMGTEWVDRLPGVFFLTDDQTECILCVVVCVYQTEKRMFADTRRRGKEGARPASTKVPIEMSFLSPAKRESSRTEEGSGMFIEIPFFLLPLRSCPVDHATPPSLHVLSAFAAPVNRVFFSNRLPRRRPIFHLSGDL